jgi:hypothetical protein
MNRAKTLVAREEGIRTHAGSFEGTDILSLLAAVRFGLEPASLLAERLGQTGIHPALIHACVETGLLVCNRTLAQATTEDLVRWNVAIDRWERMNPQVAPAKRVLTVAEFSGIARHDDSRTRNEVGKSFRCDDDHFGS